MYNYTIARAVNNFGGVRPVYAEGPHWVHYCATCQYLGFIISQDGYGEVLSPEHDVWLHGDNYGPHSSLIMRHGSSGLDCDCLSLTSVKAVLSVDVPENRLWRCAFNLFRRVTA